MVTSASDRKGGGIDRMEQVEAVVVGAGVVGLAIARRLALAGREVIVLEAADAIGTGNSSRNSEVIHAGIYYPAGSLKARLCVAGRDALYAYCKSRGIAHRRTGKLIVALAEDDPAALTGLEAKARANGVDDLTRLDRAAARRLEPALECRGALLSPSTGIVDSHGLMLALQGEAEARSAMIAFNSPVLGGRADDGRIAVRVGGAAPMELGCRVLVNAAGLAAQGLARTLAGVPADTIPPLHYAKGNYFTLGGPSPFSRMIYPLPEADALGIHVVLDLAGRTRFGPDVEWIDAPDFAVSTGRADRFYESIRRYWPDLPDGALQPGYVGIRPKLGPAGAPPADFAVHGPETHSVPGLVNLYGIDSPGLTASLAIADEVATRLGDASAQASHSGR